MVKRVGVGIVARPESRKKGTSIGRGLVKKASMNKSKKRGYKKYRGQGK